MDRNRLALVAAVLALVAVVACNLTWWSAESEMESAMDEAMEGVPPEMRGMAEGLMRGATQAAANMTVKGTNEHFNGTAVMILSILGAVAAGLVAFGQAGALPLDGRQLLFVAVLLLAIGFVLVFADLVGDPGFNAFGGWLALLATAGAAGVAFRGTMVPAPAGAQAGESARTSGGSETS